MHPDEYYSRRNKRYSESIAVLIFATLAVIVVALFFLAIARWMTDIFHVHISDIFEWAKHLPIINKWN